MNNEAYTEHMTFAPVDFDKQALSRTRITIYETTHADSKLRRWYKYEVKHEVYTDLTRTNIDPRKRWETSGSWAAVSLEVVLHDIKQCIYELGILPIDIGPSDRPRRPGAVHGTWKQI